jgi:hypothetical protein
MTCLDTTSIVITYIARGILTPDHVRLKSVHERYRTDVAVAPRNRIATFLPIHVFLAHKPCAKQDVGIPFGNVVLRALIRRALTLVRATLVEVGVSAIRVVTQKILCVGSVDELFGTRH